MIQELIFKYFLSFRCIFHSDPKKKMEFIESEASVSNISFYREINNMNRFPNQSKNPQNAIFEQDYPLCETGDLQPELCDPISRNLVVFDRFESYEKYVERP